MVKIFEGNEIKEYSNWELREKYSDYGFVLNNYYQPDPEYGDVRGELIIMSDSIDELWEITKKMMEEGKLKYGHFLCSNVNLREKEII